MGLTLIMKYHCSIKKVQFDNIKDIISLILWQRTMLYQQIFVCNYSVLTDDIGSSSRDSDETSHDDNRKYSPNVSGTVRRVATLLPVSQEDLGINNMHKRRDILLVVQSLTRGPSCGMFSRWRTCCENERIRALFLHPGICKTTPHSNKQYDNQCGLGKTKKILYKYHHRPIQR